MPLKINVICYHHFQQSIYIVKYLVRVIDVRIPVKVPHFLKNSVSPDFKNWSTYVKTTLFQGWKEKTKKNPFAAKLRKQK